MNLPNVWGPGSLFCFSGVDGQNSYNSNFVGTLCADRLGVVFHTRRKRELSLHLTDISDIRYEVVASDIIKGEFSAKGTNEAMPFAIVFHSQDVVLGSSTALGLPVLHCEGIPDANCNEHICIQSVEGEYTALISKNTAERIYFAFSYSSVSEADAVNKAEGGLKTDIHSIIEDKIAFFERLSKLKKNGNGIERTLYKCFSVLKSQVYSPEGMFKTRWTTPDRLPHKKLWLWDSVFHTFGNRYISVDLAYESIQAVLATQTENGFIPHMAAPPEERSGITQPPVVAWGLFELYMYSGDESYIRENYNSLKAYLTWNMKNRDINANNLFEWEVEKDSVTCRCGECGMDNSPRFDNVVAMDCIDFSCFMANEARAMAKIAGILGLQDEQEYWSELYGIIRNAINETLWDEEDKFYYDRILSNGKFKKVKAVSSFLPLFAGVCEKRHAEFLVKHLSDKNSFCTDFSVPSISVDDPTFGTDMWRGPVWVNYNYMLIKGLREYGYIGLADEIKEKTINAITFWYEHDGTVYEYYDALNRKSPRKLNRKGPCIEPYSFEIRYQSIRDYGWTCSVFADLIMEKYLNDQNFKMR